MTTHKCRVQHPKGTMSWQAATAFYNLNFRLPRTHIHQELKQIWLEQDRVLVKG